MLFAASAEHCYAINESNGEILWQCPLTTGHVPGLFTRPMLVAAAGQVLCARRTSQGKGILCCIKPETQTIAWTRETEAPLNLHVHQAKAFVRSGNLSAFDARTGQPLWRVPVGGCGTLSFRANRIYLVDAAEKARVLALNGETGKQVWARRLAASCNGIVVSGPVGLLSGNNHTLYAFALNENS